MTASHEADPRFVEFLEWQIRSEVRRAATLPPDPLPNPGRSRKGLRMIGLLVLTLISLSAGAAGAFTVVQIEDRAERELLVLKAEVRLEQAVERLEQSVEALEEARPLAERAFIAGSELDRLRQRIAVAERDIRRRGLDLRETRASGRPPRDDLAAPLVGGVDYVAGRLEAGLEIERLEVERLAKILAQTEKLAERGFVTNEDLETDRTAVTRAEMRLGALVKRLELRRNFIARRITAREVELHDMAETATAEFEDARITMETAEQLAKRLVVLADRGLVSRSELRETEARVQAAAARLRLAEIELRIVRSRLEGP